MKRNYLDEIAQTVADNLDTACKNGNQRITYAIHFRKIAREFVSAREEELAEYETILNMIEHHRGNSGSVTTIIPEEQASDKTKDLATLALSYYREAITHAEKEQAALKKTIATAQEITKHKPGAIARCDMITIERKAENVAAFLEDYTNGKRAGAAIGIYEATYGQIDGRTTPEKIKNIFKNSTF